MGSRINSCCPDVKETLRSSTATRYNKLLSSIRSVLNVGGDHLPAVASFACSIIAHVWSRCLIKLLTFKCSSTWGAAEMLPRPTNHSPRSFNQNFANNIEYFNCLHPFVCESDNRGLMRVLRGRCLSPCLTYGFRYLTSVDRSDCGCGDKC